MTRKSVRNHKILRRTTAWLLSLLTAVTVVGMTAPQMVLADAVERPYLALGDDLKSAERETVLSLLGVKEKNLDDYELVTITNEDEHDYLDDYLSPSIIGSRALSSVLIEKKSEGNGIHVTTKNITYCTEGMYENALTTAGITDADVVVAGPFEITGTAALVGAMKAYEAMTGEKIDEFVKDAATNELVLTGEIAEEIGNSEKAEKFIALLKKYVVEHNLDDKDEIEKGIEDCEEKLDVNLDDQEKEQIVELMQKINDIDIDVDQLKEQGKQIYEKLTGLEKKYGILDRLLQFINNLLGKMDS